MSKYLTPEEDLKYQLMTLASYEQDDIDSSEFEVGYETESGNDAFASVCCIDVGDRALKRIVELEEENDQLTEKVEELKDIIKNFTMVVGSDKAYKISDFKIKVDQVIGCVGETK